MDARDRSGGPPTADGPGEDRHLEDDLGVDLPGADDDLGDVVGRLHRAVRRAVVSLDGRPLADTQVELLRLVERRPGIGVKAAAEALRTAPNTVSTLVGELTGAGLLERVRPPENRRAVRLALTPAARRRLAGFRAHRRRLIDGVLDLLDPTARAELTRAVPHLSRLVELVEAARPPVTVPRDGTAPPAAGPPTAP